MLKLKDLKILIVRDAASDASALRGSLEELGIRRITERDSGAAALADDLLHDYNAYFVEWDLGDMDALTLLARLRENPVTAKIAFIVSDRAPTPQRFEAAAEAGVHNYVGAPFDAATLRRKMEVLLGKLA